MSKLTEQREREMVEVEKEKEKETVCVTGGGGYQASWLVKLLLSKGYMIHATVRDPNDEKNAHLKTLENASENLLLFKAEVMDYDSLFAAIKGCTGVFYLATSILPDTVPNPEVEILEACVTDQSNVLKACSATNVKRVVVVSSIAAIVYNPSWPKGEPIDESCWSDEETCKTSKTWGGYNWYHLAKTVAETQALEYGKKTGLEKVPLFYNLDDLILDNICDRVKPLVFSKYDKIIREGDPVQRMIFIVRGHLQSRQTLSKGMVAACTLGPGNFLGDELLSWCLRRPFMDRLPASLATFVCLEAT